MNRSGKKNSIDETAAMWAVRLAEGLAVTERRELDQWLAQDCRHTGAFIRAQAIWTDLDRIAALQGGSHRSAAPGRSWRNRWVMGMAASLLIALLVGGSLIRNHFAGRYAAGPGEVLRIALNDGSTVMLNTDTVIRVRFDEHERRVFLQHGEASFEVAHDITRPFVVRAREVAIRAVGTEFAVRMTDETVAVTVTEGVVEVKRSGAGTVEKRELIVRNDRIIAPESEPMIETNLTKAEVARDLSWREGLLMFDGETLAAAAAEVNRYSSTPVTIDDPELAREKFVGVFRIGNSRAFARAAAAAFDAEISEGREGIVLTRPKTPRTE